MTERKTVPQTQKNGQNTLKAKEKIFPTEPEKLSLGTLENWLFGAANILRGPVDQADYKTYIFPLLFFKRISDVYDEEYRKAFEDAGGNIEEAEFRENFHFVIPNGCQWKDVRDTTVNVGQALTHAMRCIETANKETLSEIFGDAQWTNKELFSDKILIDLIEHFSEHNLSNKNVEPDLTGQSYEYLIKKFADLSNKKAGEFYTPRPVIWLMTLILKPKDSETVYDPACGTGGMLLEAFNYVRDHKGEYRRLGLYGQEKNLTTSSIARMNLILHGLEDFRIYRADTLRRPAFFEGDTLKKFDCVIANPPFSLKKWGEEVWENDPYGRNFAGMPPSSYGDYAWVQHMIASMAKPHGRMAIVLPQGALFRKGAEGKIRSKLLEADLLEAVIGLAPNLFYGTTLAACICIFRLKKDEQHKGRVLFIDASGLFKKGKNQNELLPEHVDQIYSWYSANETRAGISRVATLDDIRLQDYNLNISLYVEPVIEEDTTTVAEALADLKKAVAECEAAENRLKQLLSEGGML
jgi:type I restriction enzyme M protein